eukprot:468196-Amphidinium_carterae.1
MSATVFLELACAEETNPKHSQMLPKRNTRDNSKQIKVVTKLTTPGHYSACANLWGRKKRPDAERSQMYPKWNTNGNSKQTDFCTIWNMCKLMQKEIVANRRFSSIVQFVI